MSDDDAPLATKGRRQPKKPQADAAAASPEAGATQPEKSPSRPAKRTSPRLKTTAKGPVARPPAAAKKKGTDEAVPSKKPTRPGVSDALKRAPSIGPDKDAVPGDNEARSPPPAQTPEPRTPVPSAPATPVPVPRTPVTSVSPAAEAPVVAPSAPPTVEASVVASSAGSSTPESAGKKKKESPFQPTKSKVMPPRLPGTRPAPASSRHTTRATRARGTASRARPTSARL